MIGHNEPVQSWLNEFLDHHGAAAGTVHLCHEGLLHLAASRRIPEAVVAATLTIPKGRGMAGLAWERMHPVSTCNLTTDTTGDVRPGAKAVNAKAAVALPVCRDDGELYAVVGIAWNDEREISEATLERLCQVARSVVTVGSPA